MSKKLLILFAIICPSILMGQQSKDWLASLEKPEYSRWELKAENKFDEHAKIDFTTVLLPNTEILGYIGNDYQRIHVSLNSINKSCNNDSIYKVQGYTIVKENKCDFKGTITIQQIREFKQMHFGVDNIFKNEEMKSQGIIISKYHFEEDPDQNHVGTFEGIMTAWWFIDRNGNVNYDNLEKHSDNYKNNQYVGTWTEYGSLKARTCNWGEYRIPFSGDLDIGAAEFSVNSKYRKMGWQDYK